MHLVNDLMNHRGESMIYAGNILSEEVHVAVNSLNELLGNTTLFQKEHQTVNVLPLSEKGEIETLVDKMKSGQIGITIYFDSNPIYHLPKEFGL